MNIDSCSVRTLSTSDEVIRTRFVPGSVHGDTFRTTYNRDNNKYDVFGLHFRTSGNSARETALRAGTSFNV